MSTRTSHPTQKDIDEAALASFTDVMRKKLARSRAKGRDGWHDPDLCSVDRLAAMMMLHERGARPDVLLRAMAAPPSAVPICRDRICFDDGVEIEIDPVWVVEVDGVTIECENEGKAKTIAGAINARSRPRADIELVAELRSALEPLAAFADIPGAGCAPGEVSISKHVEGHGTPAMTFADARAARSASDQAAARHTAFEATRPVDIATAAAIGQHLRAASDPDCTLEDCLVAIQLDPDIPLSFRDEFGAALGRASVNSACMPDRMDLLKALEPFARFGVGEDGHDIMDGLMGDRVKDWLGYSDFLAMRQVYSILSGNDLPEPDTDDEAAMVLP